MTDNGGGHGCLTIMRFGAGKAGGLQLVMSRAESRPELAGPDAAAWRGPRLCEVWGPLGLSDCETHLSVTRLLG